MLYDYEALADSINTNLFAERPFNALRCRELLGLGKGEAILSLGEGGTPLVNRNTVQILVRQDEVGPLKLQVLPESLGTQPKL